MNRLRYHSFILIALLCARPALAQVRPTMRDTARVLPDSTAPAQDTSKAAPAFADSVRPVPQLADIYQGPAHGFSDGVWEWDRAAFLTEAATTVGDLLERVPGVTVIRSGLYLQPEAASALGGTANRLEVWLDGYILDPLLEGSVDVAKIELVEVESIRVERRLSTIRVYIKTLVSHDSRAYSMVEAAVGQPTANLFRGTFLVPKLFIGPIGLGIDRIDTRGRGGSEGADQSAGWAKWSFIRKGSGVQVEYRRVQTDRGGDVPWAETYARTDLVARARAQIKPGLVAEVFAGQATAERDTTDTKPDSAHVKVKNTQYGGRVSFESPFFWANGAYRARTAEALPGGQLDGEAGVRYGLVSAVARTTQSDWRSAGTASELTLRAEAGPYRGVRIFGETTSSDRGASYLHRIPDSSKVITSYSGYRAGAEATLFGITVGAAALHIKSDSTVSFGLPFDTIGERYPGADANGWELSGRGPLPLIKGLFAEGMITDWRSGFVGLYLPTRIYRAGLEYSATPLKSGNLQVLGRLEAIHRGAMLYPLHTTGPADEPLTSISMLPLDYIDAYLQIRIIDVRAFVRYEDLQGQQLPEVPERALRGPRIFYGVKWQFFN